MPSLLPRWSSNLSVACRQHQAQHTSAVPICPHVGSSLVCHMLIPPALTSTHIPPACTPRIPSVQPCAIVRLCLSALGRRCVELGWLWLPRIRTLSGMGLDSELFCLWWLCLAGEVGRPSGLVGCWDGWLVALYFRLANVVAALTRMCARVHMLGGCI